MEFIMICGLPYSGKTTYANNNFNNVINVDKIKVNVPIERLPKVKEMVIDQLLKLDTCVVDGVFATSKVRQKFITGLPVGCKKTCIYMNTPKEICIERSKKGKSSHGIERFAITFQTPIEEEGWDEIIIIDYSADNMEVAVNERSENNS